MPRGGGGGGRRSFLPPAPRAARLRSAAPGSSSRRAGGPPRPHPSSPAPSRRAPAAPARRPSGGLPSPGGGGWSAGPGGRSRPAVPPSCCGSSSPHGRPARSRLGRPGCQARPAPSQHPPRRGGSRRWRRLQRPPLSLPTRLPACLPPAGRPARPPSLPPAGRSGAGRTASSLGAARASGAGARGCRPEQQRSG